VFESDGTWEEDETAHVEVIEEDGTFGTGVSLGGADVRL
jgi:hypothetical protein